MPPQSRTLVQRALGPADRLLSRLWYPQKFVLIGLVLILPLGWVVKSYVGVQSTNTAFAQQEAVGVAYLRPASELLARVVAARRVAVQVASHQSGQAQLDLAVRQVRTAIAGVDSMHGAGATLGLNAQWSALRQAGIDSIAAVAEQSSAATQEVSASTQETSASTGQIAASAHDLAGTASTLEELVAQFQLTA